MTDHPIVFFDGICNFCNYWVNFAIRRDKKNRLRFAALQGETAANILPAHQHSVNSLRTVMLLDNGKVYTQSSAALRICKYLDGGWKLFYGLMIVPKFIRDFLYNIVARNRYKWWGKKDTCMVPGPGIRERFLP